MGRKHLKDFEEIVARARAYASRSPPTPAAVGKRPAKRVRRIADSSSPVRPDLD